MQEKKCTIFCGPGLLFHFKKTYETGMVLVSGKTALGNFSYLQDVVGQAIMQALQHPVSHLICARLGRTWSRLIWWKGERVPYNCSSSSKSSTARAELRMPFLTARACVTKLTVILPSLSSSLRPPCTDSRPSVRSSCTSCAGCNFDLQLGKLSHIVLNWSISTAICIAVLLMDSCSCFTACLRLNASTHTLWPCKGSCVSTKEAGTLSNTARHCAFHSFHWSSESSSLRLDGSVEVVLFIECDVTN